MMEQIGNFDLISIMQENYQWAILISLSISIIVAILGIIPSYFITLANVIIFGVVGGFFLSLIGEILGATVSFILYRKGFKKMATNTIHKHKKINQIINANDREAMILIFIFRILPYMPSGFVTMAAALGKINVFKFTIASTLGKIPAMILEVLSVYLVVSFVNLEIILLIIFIILITSFIIYKSRKGK